MPQRFRVVRTPLALPMKRRLTLVPASVVVTLTVRPWRVTWVVASEPSARTPLVSVGTVSGMTLRVPPGVPLTTRAPMRLPAPAPPVRTRIDFGRRKTARVTAAPPLSDLRITLARPVRVKTLSLEVSEGGPQVGRSSPKVQSGTTGGSGGSGGSFGGGNSLVSTVKERSAGDSSRLPASSTATTWKVWAPSASPV